MRFVIIFLISIGLTSVRSDDEVTEDPVSDGEDLTVENPIAVTDPCIQPPDPGTCTLSVLRYYYSTEAQQCRQFIYGGCDGNLNRFESEAACNVTCQTTVKPIKHQASFAENDKQDLSLLGSEHLRLLNGTGETSFTFSKGNPFIELKAGNLKDFQLRNIREISFEFRSSDPKGLFLFHTLKNRPNEELKYELYVTLEGGELKIIHVYGADETTLLIGKALNRDIWHAVRIMIDPASAILEAQVDDHVTSTVLDSLKKDPSYSVSENVDSIMFIGGMDIVQDGMESSYLFEHFVGCLRNIRLRGGLSESELVNVNPFTSGFFRDITEGCINGCHTGQNKCRNGGRCINLYDRTVCDCFSTAYEGDMCDHDVPTVLTLRGYSYLSYRIYDWKDRVHSESNRISMKFRSRVGDSILFYAGGTFPETNHIAVTLLRNGSLYIEIDFGNSPQGIVLGERVTNGAWHNLTVIHEGPTVRFWLNSRPSGSITVTGEKYHLRFDPHIYVGGDRKPIGPGLLSTNSFVGCLSHVYVNHINILYGLRSGHPQAIYHGILSPELQVCEEVKIIPVTFPFAESEIQIDDAIVDNKIELRLEFKTSQTVAVIAHGVVTMESGSKGFWEMRIVRGELQFLIIPEATNETNFYVLARTGRRLSDNQWHVLKLDYVNDEVILHVDHFKQSAKHDEKMEISRTVVIGTSLADPHLGIVGCMQKIFINGEEQDPRLLVTGRVREVSLDNCQLVDPCKRPNACEHGGRCIVDDGRVVCDCTGTGYTGKNCHFALYKRTCEELALLGYQKSGVFEIDIDGNGPHPPAHVRCEFEISGARKTVVDHNLPTDMEIHSRRVGDVLIDLTYREFTPEMLQSLISQSLQCQQHIRYDCKRAPLELHSYTWFRSSSGSILDYLGASKPGRCPCAEGRQCVHTGLFCNCDANEDKWMSDEGYLVRPEELGITQIFALQPKKLHPFADGRINLGPLECVEANTQQYVVTFKSADSYMEVPGWRTGDLAFSFRTSNEQGILLYQPMLHPKHPYFRVILVNDHELTLEFSINGEPRSVTVKSTRDMNSGEWQQVWIDYNEYHVRFTVNQESILMDLKDGEEFGPFEATLYIGGAPEEMLQASNHSEGLIGCYRGLVMNNEVVNLYAYMNARFPDMIQKHCLPSCDPNPCKNGATCHEFWGSYKCMCANQLAHFGHNCETNINTNALTFRSHGAFVESNAPSKTEAESFGLLRFFSEDILLNLRTFDAKSLVFYAYDFMNNFVQLHIDRDSKMIFTFNSEYEIHQVSVSLEGLTNGESIQILIDRELESTTLNVNGVTSTVAAPLKPITKYKRNPWTNSELEMIKPPRPVRRPEEFYQVFLGGVDTEYMETVLPGFVGCLRGLKLGSQVIDLMNSKSENLARDISLHGVTPGCSMLCDKLPCKNGGSCHEDFVTHLFTCDCEFTSYFGDTCTEEKGANFGGDSYIVAKHAAKELNSVRVQLAFSTTAVRNVAQALLLVQTENQKTKYLLITLTHLGYLRIEEDRGNGVVFGAEVKSINFLNGARHSIFYKRKGDSAHLMVDRSDIPLRPLATSIHIDLLAADVTDKDAIHVGGIRESNDPRFSEAYDHFYGCLSNVYIELDGEEIQPLLIYLGYEKGHDDVTFHDPSGIEEEARCAAFSINPPGVIERQTSDSRNETYVVIWNRPPLKISPYLERFVVAKVMDMTGINRLLVGIGVIFLVFIVFMGLYMWRAERKHRRRKLEEDQSPLIPPPSLTSKPMKPALRQQTKDSGVNARLPSPARKASSSSKPVEDLIQLLDQPNQTFEKSVLAPTLDTSVKEIIIDHVEEIRDDLLKEGRLEPEGQDSELLVPADVAVCVPSFEITDTSVDVTDTTDSSNFEQGSVENLVEDPENQSEYLEEDNIMTESYTADSGIDQDSPQPTVNDLDVLNDQEIEPVAPLDDLDGDEPDSLSVEGQSCFPPIMEEDEDDINAFEIQNVCQTPENSCTSDSESDSQSSLNEGGVEELDVGIDGQSPVLPLERKFLRRQHSLPTSAIDLHPIHLSDDCRTFTNPISYLGGPRIKNSRPVSQESMVSIDD